jgi:O-antigen/teichoic acid export membrane protein
MFGYSGWIFIIRLSSTIVNKLDQVLVSSILGVSQLPIYVGVSHVLKIVGQINSLLKSAVLPIASEVYANTDKGLIKDISIRGTKMLNSIFAPLTVSIIIFANPILFILGGAEVAQYSRELQIGSILFMPVLCRAFLNTVVMGAGHIIRIQSLWSVTTSFVYLLVCLIGLKFFGLKGAILAHPITHVIMMYPWLYLIFKNIDLQMIDFWRAVFWGQWPSLMVLIVAYPLTKNLFVGLNTYFIVVAFSTFVLAIMIVSWFFTIEKNVRMEIYKMFKSSFVKSG